LSNDQNQGSKIWQPKFSSIAQKFWVKTKMFLVARSMVDIEALLIKQLKHRKVFQMMINFFLIY
jgi:hypothetical protein